MLARPYVGWTSPWREMQRLRRDMNRLFGDLPEQARWDAAAGFPALNVWTNENSAVVTAELPGLIPEDLEISVEEDVLMLRGLCRRETVEGATYHRRERRCGTFLRTARLPFRVDAAQVEATFSSGVLSIVLPRAEEDKPKKIAIRAG